MVIDIAEARKRRDQVRAAAEWAFSQLPWTDGALTDEFHRRWPGLTSAELVEVRRLVDKSSSVKISGPHDLLALRARLRGSEEHWRPAMVWLIENEPDITSPEFVRKFGHISRSEVMLAILERGRRLEELAGGGQ